MNRKGQTLIEFAFLLPLLLLLVLGIFEFGRALYTKNTLNNAARAGVRVAVVTAPYDATLNPNGLEDTGGTPQYLNSSCSFGGANSLIYQTVCNGMFNGIPKNEVNVSVATNDLDSSGTYTPGDLVTVTVTWNSFPLFAPNFVNITNTLTGEALMRYE